MYVVECKPDKVLVVILVKRRDIIHAGDKGRVVKYLGKHPNSIGVVDEDPGASWPGEIREYRELRELQECGIRIFLHRIAGSKLIVLCPRLEEWILEAAKEVSLDVQEFKLSEDPRRLHETINLRTEEFQQLAREMLRRKSRRLSLLKRELLERAGG